jgi:hypothetical protein
MNRRIAHLAVAAAAAVALSGGLAAAASSAADAAPALTVTCVSCIHVQNVYAFRGALDAAHAATAVNTPIVLWYEQATTTDSGADLLVVPAGTVTQSLTTADFGVVNQSNLNWISYLGDTVVRFKYDPFGDGGANTYVGLNRLTVSLRHDNPDSIWQEFIEVPVSAAGSPDGQTVTETGGTVSFTGSTGPANVKNACGAPTTVNPAATGHCVLIDVGQTANPGDPMVVTDPNDAFTGSLVPQVVGFENPNQFGAVPTNEVWDFRA